MDESDSNDHQSVEMTTIPSTAHSGDESNETVPPPPATATVATDENEEDTQTDEDEEKLVVVNVKFLNRGNVTIRCSAEILISNLKRMVLEAHASAEEDNNSSNVAPNGNQNPPLRLIYKGKVLKDAQTLNSYHFQHKDTIHAVFDRPQTITVSESSTVTTGLATSAAATTTSSSSISGTASTVTSTPMRDMGNGYMMGQINVVSDPTSPMPDIGGLISSMISGITGGIPGGAPTRISIFGDDRPSTGPSASLTAPTNSSDSSSTQTTTTSNINTTFGSTSFTTAPIPAMTMGSTVPTSNTTSLLNQAAAVRRMIPALELVPLSRPDDLSVDMYTMGNALREASDTFLAIHRQLQFVSARFLHENHLTDLERTRLRARVHQLVPVLEQISSLATAVSRNLAGSSYGPRHQETDANRNTVNETAGNAHIPPSTVPAIPVVSYPVAAPLAAVLGAGNQPNTGISDIGNSIASILQAVSGIGSEQASIPTPPSTTSTANLMSSRETSTQQTNRSGPGGGFIDFLNMISALTSPGVSTSGADTSTSTTPSNTNVANPILASSAETATQPTAQFPDRDHLIVPSTLGTQTEGTIGSPLSNLVTETMRDFVSAGRENPDVPLDYWKSAYQSLSRQLRSLIPTSSPSEHKETWCKVAADQVERTMEKVLLQYQQTYTMNESRTNKLVALFKILLEVCLIGTDESGEIATGVMNEFRSRWQQLVELIYEDLKENRDSFETIRLTSNIFSELLLVEDPELQGTAERISGRITDAVISFLKNRSDTTGLSTTT